MTLDEFQLHLRSGSEAHKILHGLEGGLKKGEHLSRHSVIATTYQWRELRYPEKVDCSDANDAGAFEDLHVSTQ